MVFPAYKPETSKHRSEAPTEFSAPAIPGGRSFSSWMTSRGPPLGGQRTGARGYTVIGAANSSQALSAVNARHGEIDLLVTDVVMPGNERNRVGRGGHSALLRYTGSLRLGPSR